MPTFIFKIECSVCQTLMTYKILEEAYKKSKNHPILCKYCGHKCDMSLVGRRYSIIQ